MVRKAGERRIKRKIIKSKDPPVDPPVPPLSYWLFFVRRLDFCLKEEKGRMLNHAHNK